jgi:hypothetical protein
MTTKSYFLAPNFSVSPNTAIALGHIITHPEQPLESLNSDDRLPVPESVIFNSEEKGFKATRNQVRDGKFGVWATVLEGAGFGGGTGVDFNSSKDDVFNIDLLKTTFMWPAPKATKDYIRESVELDGVASFLTASRYKKPVYMITGLKIAQGASVTSGGQKGQSVATKLMVDRSPGGVPVRLGHRQR